MELLSRLTNFFRRGGQGQAEPKGKTDLQKNMEKALHMKQEAGSATTTPEHQTAHDGPVHGQQLGANDRDAASQGSHTPQLKRSRVARSGDAS